MATKPAKKKRAATKRRARQPKAKARDVKEYARKYRAWGVEAHKVLAAEELMKLAGGYKEAFILLDAVIFARLEKHQPALPSPKAGPPAAATETEYREIVEACEAAAHKVLAAERLLDLAGGDQEAFALLDVVMIAAEGHKGYRQAGDVHLTAAGHHEVLAVAEEKGGK
jgi:hypothetical protein